MKYLTVGAKLKCFCGAEVKLATEGDPRFAIGGENVLTVKDLRAASIVGCANKPPYTTPCKKIVEVVSGLATGVSLAGAPEPVLDNVEAIADGMPVGRISLGSPGADAARTRNEAPSAARRQPAEAKKEEEEEPETEEEDAEDDDSTGWAEAVDDLVPSSGSIPFDWIRAAAQPLFVRIPIPQFKDLLAPHEMLAIELWPRNFPTQSKYFGPRIFFPKVEIKGGRRTSSTIFIQDFAGKVSLRLDFGDILDTNRKKVIDYHWNAETNTIVPYGTNPKPPKPIFGVDQTPLAIKRLFGNRDHVFGKAAERLFYLSAKFYRLRAGLFAVVGYGADVWRIVTASNPIREASRTVTGWAGAWAGCKVLGGAGAAGGTATGNPLAAVGAGFFGCIIGGVVGEHEAHKVYDWAEDVVFHPRPWANPQRFIPAHIYPDGGIGVIRERLTWNLRQTIDGLSTIPSAAPPPVLSKATPPVPAPAPARPGTLCAPVVHSITGSEAAGEVCLTLWVNAFIPGDIPNYSRQLQAGPYAGRTAIPFPSLLGPLDLERQAGGRLPGCLTDQRTFSDELGARSHMRSLAIVRLSPDIALVHTSHDTSGATEVDLRSGLEEKFGCAVLDRCSFGPLRRSTRLPHGLREPAVQVVIDPAELSKPGAALDVLELPLRAEGTSPWAWADIDYRGTFFLYVSRRPGQPVRCLVEFEGLIEGFPAYEAYARLDGVTKPLFASSPPDGNTILSQVGWPTYEIDGRAEFPDTA